MGLPAEDLEPALQNAIDDAKQEFLDSCGVGQYLTEEDLDTSMSYSIEEDGLKFTVFWLPYSETGLLYGGLQDGAELALNVKKFPPTYVVCPEERKGLFGAPKKNKYNIYGWHLSKRGWVYVHSTEA